MDSPKCVLLKRDSLLKSSTAHNLCYLGFLKEGGNVLVSTFICYMGIWHAPVSSAPQTFTARLLATLALKCQSIKAI